MIVNDNFKQVIEKLLGDDSLLQRFMKDESFAFSLGLTSTERSAIQTGLGSAGIREQSIQMTYWG